ncbi:MAG: phage tail tube protein [Nitrospiraceae bacterium]
MASGTGGQIAIKKTSSLYLNIESADSWTNFVTESIEHNLEELEEGSITGRRDAPPSWKGIDFAEGDITFEPNPNAIGHFLNGAFGTIASSMQTDAGSTGANSGEEAGKPVFVHTFTPRQAAFDERTFLEPYTVMVYKDTGSAFFNQGSIFNRLEFNIQAGQLMNATVGLMARAVTRGERIAAASTFISSGGRPWIWDMSSVEVASGGEGVSFLAGNTNFEQVQLSLETPQEGVVLLDGNKNYAEFQPNDFRRVNLSGTISFRNQEEYNAFIAYESRYMRITITNANSASKLGNVDPGSVQAYALQFDIPKMKFLTWSTPLNGPNRLQTSFTAKAEYSDTDGYMIRAILTNVTSFY